MEFYRQEYWSGLPFPSPGDSSGPGDRTRVSHIAGSVSHQGSPLVASLVRVKNHRRPASQGALAGRGEPGGQADSPSRRTAPAAPGTGG